MPRRNSIVLKAKGYWTKYWSLKIFFKQYWVQEILTL
jgi:hypothetical protein